MRAAGRRTPERGMKFRTHHHVSEPRKRYPRERSQTQKTTEYVIPLILNVQNRQIRRDKQPTSSRLGMGEGMGEQGWEL